MIRTLIRLLFIPVVFLFQPSGAQATGDEEASLTLVFGGDVMLARGVSAAIRTHDPSWPWGDVLPLLRDADLALVNLECVIGRAGNEFMPRRVFYFRAIPEAADSLASAGIDLVSLANNHAMDFREKGLMETRAYLAREDIAFTGAGRDLNQAREPAMLESGGIQIAVVSFADHFREYAATSTSAGINYTRITTSLPEFEAVRETIARARRQGADLAVFSMHWGPNMNKTPLPGFREFAHAIIDAGIDIFHGHSAHIFQGIEYYREGLILYDTGDLIDDYMVYPRHRNDLQLLFVVKASVAGIAGLQLVPLKISGSQVNRATGTDFSEIQENIKTLSAPFGTGIQKQGNSLMTFRLEERGR